MKFLIVCKLSTEVRNILFVITSLSCNFGFKTLNRVDVVIRTNSIDCVHYDETTLESIINFNFSLARWFPFGRTMKFE